MFLKFDIVFNSVINGWWVRSIFAQYGRKKREERGRRGQIDTHCDTMSNFRNGIASTPAASAHHK